MSEQVFRCDYCGEFVPMRDGKIYGFPVVELHDGRTLVVPSVFCCDYCGTQATNHAGTARG